MKENKTSTNTDLITVIEASKIIGIMSSRWVQELASNWTLKSIRPGKRKFYIYAESLKEYLKGRWMDDIAETMDEKIKEIRNEK